MGRLLGEGPRERVGEGAVVMVLDLYLLYSAKSYFRHELNLHLELHLPLSSRGCCHGPPMSFLSETAAS